MGVNTSRPEWIRGGSDHQNPEEENQRPLVKGYGMLRDLKEKGLLLPSDVLMWIPMGKPNCKPKGKVASRLAFQSKE